MCFLAINAHFEKNVLPGWKLYSAASWTEVVDPGPLPENVVGPGQLPENVMDPGLGTQKRGWPRGPLHV